MYALPPIFFIITLCMTINTKKTIGILGGMGPGASAYFYQLLVEQAQKQYQAEQDIDYPPMVLYNLPLEGFSERGVEDTEKVKAQLIAGVKKLESAGADFIVIPCNTVHIYQDDMRQAVSIPIISIVEETVKAVQKKGMHHVGIVSSETTRDLGLYHNALKTNGNRVIEANVEQQGALSEIILSVMSGDYGKSDVKVLDDIMNDFVGQGAEAIVVGCTELPLVAQGIAKHDVILFDSTLILAEATLAYAYGQ